MKCKVRGQSAGVGNSALAGCVTSIIVTILMLCLTAYLEITEKISENTGERLVVGIQFLSTVVGCIVAGRNKESGFLISTLIAGAGYFLLLVTISIIFFDGSLSSVLQGLLAIASGAAVSLVFAWWKKRSGGTRNRRVYSR